MKLLTTKPLELWRKGVRKLITNILTGSSLSIEDLASASSEMWELEPGDESPRCACCQGAHKGKIWQRITYRLRGARDGIQQVTSEQLSKWNQIAFSVTTKGGGLLQLQAAGVPIAFLVVAETMQKRRLPPSRLKSAKVDEVTRTIVELELWPTVGEA